jgi:hypothetical protein
MDKEKVGKSKEIQEERLSKVPALPKRTGEFVLCPAALPVNIWFSDGPAADFQAKRAS